tara:strand:- start:254 stop:694 length:441 start_codon:yes stop_codon:yes gene_type:complete
MEKIKSVHDFKNIKEIIDFLNSSSDIKIKVNVSEWAGGSCLNYETNEIEDIDEYCYWATGFIKKDVFLKKLNDFVEEEGKLEQDIAYFFEYIFPEQDPYIRLEAIGINLEKDKFEAGCGDDFGTEEYSEEERSFTDSTEEDIIFYK